jgi:beta-ribofuranosylaminobenzene 5'-phosphate synthase
MTEQVTIGCGARLHLGFLDLNGGLGRRFGSLGLALEAPETRLVLRRAVRPGVAGPEAARGGRALAIMQEALGITAAHALLIEAAMPAHAGLGSGTQLALAVATALRRLHGLPPALAADATRLGRGARSGIGIALFEGGGFVLDGGRGARAAPPPLLARLPVPADWRVLLLLDPAASGKGGAGLAGAAERDAFAALPPMPPAVADALCRRVLMGVLPALAEGDLVAFGAALTEVQRAVGDHFAPAQGGRFASARVAAALDRLAALGGTGLGQSSWGPSGFAFAPDPEAAAWLRARLAADPDMPEVRVCRPRNHGPDLTADGE